MVLVMMKKRQESDTAAFSDVYLVQTVKASRPKSTSLFTVDVNSDWFYAFILTATFDGMILWSQNGSLCIVL